MKRRFSILVVAIPLVLTTIAWVVTRDHSTTIQIVAAPAPLAAVSAQPSSGEPIQPVIPAITEPASAVAPVELHPSPTSPAPASKSQETSKDVPAPAVDRVTRHVAQPGDTVASLAADLLGEDNRANRDALIDANVSLQADPDLLLAGKSYIVPAPADATHDTTVEKSAQPAVEPAAVAPQVTKAKPNMQDSMPAKRGVELNYIAAIGDTVSNMAGAFLGGDGKIHKDAIINANTSLQADPDHVVVGKAYRIPIPAGLSGSADSARAQPTRPLIQPDADDLVLAGSPRTLRYTARPGDTLTSMAVALLGQDTPETRGAIRSNNPTLKANPDKIIVGHTYWIPAPTDTSGQKPRPE
jgi:hypothetical protein